MVTSKSKLTSVSVLMVVDLVSPACLSPDVVVVEGVYVFFGSCFRLLLIAFSIFGNSTL